MSRGFPLNGSRHLIEHRERLVPPVAEQGHYHPRDPRRCHLGQLPCARDHALEQRYVQRAGVAPALGSKNRARARREPG